MSLNQSDTPDGEASRAQALAAWVKRARKPSIKPNELDAAMSWSHPRVQFIKTLPLDASLLDFGAGDGGLSVYRIWPAPRREDLNFFGYSLEPVERAREYRSVEIARFEDRAPNFGGRVFDAVFCSHVIEHLGDLPRFFAWLSAAVAPGGRVYLEWPSPVTLGLPKRTTLLEFGVDLMVSNFYDDATHIDLPERAAVSAGLESVGFAIETSAIVRLPFYEDELLAHDQIKPNPGYRLQAYWSYTGWCQYLVAQKQA
jgi:SAM-dependent methyltransferase